MFFFFFKNETQKKQIIFHPLCYMLYTCANYKMRIHARPRNIDNRLTYYYIMYHLKSNNLYAYIYCGKDK